MRELTIAAVEVEAVRGPAGRFPYPVQWQAQPLDVYLAPGERASAPAEPDPAAIVEMLYVRITTRQGPQGLYGPVDPVAAWPLTQILAPFLAGQDALAGATLWDKMQRLDRHSRHGHLKLAVSAADNALWDLRGRAFDAPVWQLLGGSGRASVPAYVSTLGVPHDPDTVRSVARELAAAGFAGQKWFPAHGRGSGAEGLRANITLAETVREAVGPDVPLMFDAFMSWDLPYAIAWCQAVANLRPGWLEEPFAPAQVDAYAALRDKTAIPLAAGEHLYDRPDVLPFLSQRLLTVLQPDPEWCGGVTELTRICALAEAFGVPVIPHGHGLHAAVHVIASQSPGTCPMAEYLYRIAPGRHRFEAAPPEPAGGAFPLPRRPGFGIELNDDAITSRRSWDGRLPEWLLAISKLVSDTIRMGERGIGPVADRILVAQLAGEARHHAKWRPLSQDEEAAALAGLRTLAGGRADLLAEVAGILEGTSEGELDEPLARCAAWLCRQAGADPAAIPAWIEEGRRRSANARQPPFSGGPRCLTGAAAPSRTSPAGTAGRLASYKKPTGLVVLDELPRNASGKILKYEPRARYGEAPRRDQNGGSSLKLPLSDAHGSESSPRPPPPP